MERVFLDLEVKAIEGDQRVVTGVASNISTDRMGDVVVPRGAVFQLPIPLLWQHDQNQPIGHVVAAEVSDAEIRVTARLASIAEAGPLKVRLDEAWQSIKSGLVRGLSIGFNSLESEPIHGGGTKYTKWSWLELSACTIPANAGAGITGAKAAVACAARVDARRAFGKAFDETFGPGSLKLFVDEFGDVLQQAFSKHGRDIRQLKQIVTDLGEIATKSPARIRDLEIRLEALERRR